MLMEADAQTPNERNNPMPYAHPTAAAAAATAYALWIPNTMRNVFAVPLQHSLVSISIVLDISHDF